ncbi:MAG: hypothetical protein GY791_07015 [Alphaproteobacteria bacterium]|nr:hypothetical protein [Alphaproteobacteria bacterium]
MADRLTSQLVKVADIVGDLGLNIAEAQKELNRDYLENLKQLMKVVGDTLGTENGTDEQRAALVALVKSLAPSRYQYTETTLDFSADIAETLQVGGQVGLGASFKVISVNASMTLGYGYDYRAAARITTTIHALPDPGLSEKLLDQSAAIRTNGAALPAPADIDKEIYDGVSDVMKALTGEAAANAGGG